MLFQVEAGQANATSELKQQVLDLVERQRTAVPLREGELEAVTVRKQPWKRSGGCWSFFRS